MELNAATDPLARLGVLTPPVPSRVARSFAFVDVCGFSSFTELQGDEAAAAVLHTLRAIVRSAAAAHGVRVDKWLGDGVMLVGVEPTQLAAAACDVLGSALALGLPLDLRAGMASGLVMVFDGDDYIGSCINLAARLCDLAAPSTLLIPRELDSALPASATVAHSYNQEVDGFPEPVAVSLVLPEVPRASGTQLLGAAVGALVDSLLSAPRNTKQVAAMVRHQQDTRARTRALHSATASSAPSAPAAVPAAPVPADLLEAALSDPS